MGSLYHILSATVKANELKSLKMFAEDFYKDVCIIMTLSETE